MRTVLAFDVYGTLIDTAGVVSGLRKIVGAKAEEFARVWRDKQLEYSFRRGLMQRYQNFAICIRDSLEYTSAYLDAPLTPANTESLLGAYRALPRFDDAKECLSSLPTDDFALYAFSNGAADTVETLLSTAGIRKHFLGVISVDDVRSFKPDPAVYRYFLRQSGADENNAWLISGNAFDVIGAMSAGMRGAWVNRSGNAIFDPWGVEPTITVSSLLEIRERITACYRPSADKPA